MTTANHNISSPVSQINRRTVLAGAVLAGATAAGTAHATAALVFAPSALGHEIIALMRAYRVCNVESEAPEELTARYEQLAVKVFAEPLSPSNLVDRALASQFSPQEELGACWLPNSTEAIDVHDCKDGAIVAILALAGLPIE
jgi:hypothetical protein